MPAETYDPEVSRGVSFNDIFSVPVSTVYRRENRRIMSFSKVEIAVSDSGQWGTFETVASSDVDLGVCKSSEGCRLASCSPEEIMNWMGHHKSSPEDIMEGCTQLIRLSSGKPEGHGLVAEAGVLATLVECLALHSMHVAVLEKIIELMCALTLVPAVRGILRSLDGIESVILTMRRNPTHRAIQVEGCTFMANVVFQSSNNKVLTGRVGGITALLRAMRDFPWDVVLQTRACLALRNICWTSEENQILVGEMRGIGFILAALARHAADHTLVEQGMVALCNVSLYCPENRRKLLSTCREKTILTALRLHQNNKVIAEHAIALVTHLVGLDSGFRRQVCLEGGIELILAAMKNFSGDTEVVLKAALLLRHLSTFEESRGAIFRLNGIEALSDALIIALKHDAC